MKNDEKYVLGLVGHLFTLVWSLRRPNSRKLIKRVRGGSGGLKEDCVLIGEKDGTTAMPHLR